MSFRNTIRRFHTRRRNGRFVAPSSQVADLAVQHMARYRRDHGINNVMRIFPRQTAPISRAARFRRGLRASLYERNRTFLIARANWRRRHRDM